MALSPDEQKRLIVSPATLTGSPARTAATRAMLCPWAPCGWPHPRMTSSTSLGSSCGTLPSASLMQWAARSDGSVMLNEPRCDLASGVRELETTTASLMGVALSWGRVPQMIAPPSAWQTRGFGAGALDFVDRLRRPPGEVLDPGGRDEDVVLDAHADAAELLRDRVLDLAGLRLLLVLEALGRGHAQAQAALELLVL